MKGQSTYSRNWKRIAGGAVVAFVLTNLFWNLDGGAQGCNLLEKTAWVAVDVLRPVILAGWQSMPACLGENSGCLQHLFQVVASLWPLLCVLVGYAKRKISVYAACWFADP